MITYRHPAPEDFVIYDGETFRVEWYYLASGEMPARDYFDTLPEADQLRLLHYVKFIADKPVGTLLPKTMYRVEDKANKIYAFKPRAHRLFNFTTEGRRIIITNAYQKHSRKMTREDLEKLALAARYRGDYLKRVQEGTYYEEAK